MLKDLEKLQAFLDEVFPDIKRGDELGSLRQLFQSSLPLPIFDHNPEYAQFLKSVLPPEGQIGTLNDIFKNWPQFSVCLFYDRMDAFWGQRVQDARFPKKRDVHSMWDAVETFKEASLDETGLARRILLGHFLHDRLPKSQHERAKLYRPTADIARGSGTPIEETINYFTKPRAGADFATIKNVAPNGWHFMPEDSLSSYLAYLRVNPKLHLVASDFEGQGFMNDGVFFEGANFRYANLSRTTWEKPNKTMKGMLLEGAILSKADALWPGSLTEAVLAQNYIDITTVLPKGFKYERIMEMHESLNMPPAPPITDFEWENRKTQRMKIIDRRPQKNGQSSDPSAP